MQRSALGLLLALSVVASACAMHPVSDAGYHDPYRASGGERAAYEYEQQRAWQQQRAWERAAAREEAARRHAYAHERRERARWEHEQRAAARAAAERAARERHADARDRAVHVTGHGPVGRVAPAQAPSHPSVRVAPVAPPPAARVAPAPSAPAQAGADKGRWRGAQIHRSVARPE